MKIEDFPVEVGGLAHHRAGNKLLYVYHIYEWAHTENRTQHTTMACTRFENNGTLIALEVPLSELETPEARCIRDVEFQQWTGKLLDSLHEQEKVKETKGPTLVH